MVSQKTDILVMKPSVSIEYACEIEKHAMINMKQLINMETNIMM